jgi:hypothetical protein
MHGAGLTHLLFLPPWAALLEMFARAVSLAIDRNIVSASIATMSAIEISLA